MREGGNTQLTSGRITTLSETSYFANNHLPMNDTEPYGLVTAIHVFNNATKGKLP